MELLEMADVTEMDRELRYKIDVRSIRDGRGQEQAVVTYCSVCHQRVEHFVPFAEAQRYADQHATPGNLASCASIVHPAGKGLRR